MLQIEYFDENSGLRCDTEFSDESIDKLMGDLNFNLNNGFNPNKYSNCDNNKWNELSTKEISSSSKQPKDNSNIFVDPSAPNESLISFSSDESNNKLSLNEDLIHYSYEEIRCSTNNFDEKSVTEGGHKLGEGGFGAVFRCRLKSNPNYIAIKKLKNDFQKQFESELKVLSKFRHPNLLSLFGISSDGPSLLIIYEYMSNGSLQDYLEHRRESLLWPKRLDIALGTAKGICHLHTFAEKPYVHRDIKSANVLLDNQLNPKVGDFGLVRVGSGGTTSTKPLATTIFGTSIYMAPEAFRGDISVKLDTFSYGIVLLELLTGLKPYDESREGYDLLSYIEEKSSDFDDEEELSSVVSTTIDKSIGDLDEKLAIDLWQMSRKCTEHRKALRPTMTEVCLNWFRLLISFQNQISFN